MNFVLGTMTFGESVFSPDVKKFIEVFIDNGGVELDTAYVYNEGKCEELIGEAIKSLDGNFKVSSKVNPRITGRLDAEAAHNQVNESLKRLGLESMDTVYLHFPDPETPIEDVLKAMNDLYLEGKFKELGLSNFPAWMVSQVWEICDKNNWIKPTVFQGLYNPLSRTAEKELNDCLNYYGIRFYAFNPMAGGLLTGRYKNFEDIPETGRFTNRPNYMGRFWKPEYFEAVRIISEAAANNNMSTIEATYRWLGYHSMLNSNRGDSILIGASKIEHLENNLKALSEGPLPNEVVEAFEKAWHITSSEAPDYYKFYKGQGSVGGEILK